MSGPDPVDEVEALIAEFQASDLRELHVRTPDLELYLSKDEGAGVELRDRRVAPSPSPASAAPTLAPPPAPSPVERDGALPPGTVPVAAPYLGTFYRSPKPGAAPYVELGATVTAETELCLVEVMKLFTAVRAGAAGTVEACLAADGQMVQAGQPLFAIRPA